MRRNTPGQYRKHKGWQTTLSIISPALLSALMLISAECFAQTQTYVLGEHQ